MRRLIYTLFGGQEVHGHRTLSSWKLGAGFMVFALVFGWASFNKVELKEWLTPSETIKVHLARNHVVVPYYSKAKVNWVPVGLVTDLEEMDDGSALVTLEVDTDIPAKLGTAPTAELRPATLLGGTYFIDLRPGGGPGDFTGGTIPVERTKMPVELDRFLASFQPNAQVGLRGFLDKFDKTLTGGGTAALQRLVDDAPGSLKPTGEVLGALRGTNPDRDLTDFVTGFEATSRALTDKPGQLRGIAGDLAVTASSFGRQSSAFSAALDELPESLTAADTGLRRLNTTLDTLRDTASDLRPTARQLGDTLDRIDPVLADARPVVGDLRGLLDDARPLLDDLDPVVRDTTDVFDDISGAVAERTNGPIRDLVTHDFQGVGPYAQTRTDRPIFEELAFMVNNLDRATTMDRNGGTINFEPDPHGFEFFENVLRNDGQPRTETLQRTLTDPQRQSPPLQAPKLLQPPHPGGETADGKQQGLLPGLSKEGGR